MFLEIPYLRQWRCSPAAPDADLLALAAELRRDVTILAEDIGPRGVHAPERYRLAEAFLTSSLRKMGLEVNRIAVATETMECANLEVVVRGTAGDRERRGCIIVGAHYDSVEACPAANDNGSGVAAVLALARRFAGQPRACDVRFVLFANEEPPFFNMNDMGSQQYARDSRKRGDLISGMICLETIGCYLHEPETQRWPHPLLKSVLPDVGDFIAFVGQASSRRLIRRASEAFAAQEAFSLVAAAAPSSIAQVLWSDHRGFNEAGYEAFMVTDTAPLRYGHYHLESDTAEKLDYVSMARVVRGVAGVVEAIAG